MSSDSPKMSAANAADGLPEGLGRKEIHRIIERYHAVDRERLQRVQTTLTRDQQRLFQLLPLLLHINHSALPGYSGERVPAGLADFTPDRDSLLHARSFSSTLKLPRHAPHRIPLLGLYLIGSSGTLGQDRHSDFDFWVCHHPDLSTDELAAVQQKLDKLHQYAETLGLHMHFFLLHAQGFRNRKHNRLSKESSGDTQHHLLLEEFYRSGLRVAGLQPLWWLIPPDQAGNYDAYRDHLVKHRFIDAEQWLDFGGLDDVDANEFFSAAHWQLYKGVDLPYKALLKLLLFNAYAAEYPNIRWLSNDIKQTMHGDKPVDADAVDAYVLLLQRVEKYLLDIGDRERLELARRAFYFKAGAHLSQTRASKDWRYQRLLAHTRRWGWDNGELLNLDSQEYWKLERVREERNLLVAELSYSYRQLTDFARRHVSSRQVDNHDLALLGRKLYATLERRPGKVDLVNPGISRDLSADAIWLQRSEQGWHLYTQVPVENAPPAKSTLSLLEMLAWLLLNRILERHTRVDLSHANFDANEFKRRVDLLRQALPHTGHPSLPLRNFASSPLGQLSVATIDLQASTGAADALRQIRAVEHLQGNSWEELQVSRYAEEQPALDLLCAHLDLFHNNMRDARLLTHCPAHGLHVKARLDTLSEILCTHFSTHGESASLILEINRAFHIIEPRRQKLAHREIGDQRDLLDYLGEPIDRYRSLGLIAPSLEESPLAFVLGLNRPDRVQVCLRCQSEGISLFVLDQHGALHQQWYPGAERKHLLLQLSRFFDTLETWQQFLPGQTDAFASVEYLQLQGHAGKWQVQALAAPEILPNATELLLVTGRNGPWHDGFSLVSGTREFNSAELGKDIYRQVVDYVLSLRRNQQTYPLYLTGITVADKPGNHALSLIELLGFKRLLEKRLADAMTQRCV